MARTTNLPVDHAWSQIPNPCKNSHIFKDGEYIESPWVREEYPKYKYHATLAPVLVNSEDEEIMLGDGWEDSPAKHGIVTAPSAEENHATKIKQAAAGANWKVALGVAAQNNITEEHIEFLQSFGRQDIKTIGDVYTFLTPMTSQQMKSFMDESGQWIKQRKKKAN